MRLDQYLVANGIAESRARAQALIRAGLVAVNGAVCVKPSRETPAGAVVRLTGALCPYVSRAGLKLEHALETFGVSPQGRVVLDLGASTGGFTEVCLLRGAVRVYAVDVGRGQLHARLRDDPRVLSLEGLNAKDLTKAHMPEPPELITADLSFISLAKALPVPLSLAAPEAEAVLLVKPQFEVGRAAVGKGGIVKDPIAREAAVEDAAEALRALGWIARGRTVSPILGGDGNEEWLLWAQREDQGSGPDDQ